MRLASPTRVRTSRARATALALLRPFTCTSVGYAVCSDAEIARVVALAKTPFNVNAAAQAAAVAALDDDEWMRSSVARIRAERTRLRAAIEVMGFDVAASQGNFLFIDCKGDSSTF